MYIKGFIILIIIFILIIVLENKRKRNNIFEGKDDEEFNVEFIENTDEKIFKNTAKYNNIEKTKNNSLYKIEPNIENEIKKNRPYFQIGKLVEWVEEIFKDIYIQIDKGNIDELINICDKEFFSKLKNCQDVKNDVGIIDGIDNINIEFIKIVDYRKDNENNIEYITLALTTILIDDYMKEKEQKSKYWSIIYEITLKRNLVYMDGNNKISIDNLNCQSCGAPIQIKNNINTCSYCGKNFIINFSNWKIYNIKRVED